MKNINHPAWLLVINTLAFLLLFTVFFSHYHTVQSIIPPEHIVRWKPFALLLLVFFVVHLGYAIYAIVAQKQLNLWYAVAALLAYSGLLYAYIPEAHYLVPSSVPPWMVSGNVSLYVYTFLMPTLAHALLVLVEVLTPKNKTYNPWSNLLLALAVPVSWYVFFQVILPLVQLPYSNRFLEHIGAILLIISTLVFLFFLIRLIFVLIMQKQGWLQKYSLVWKIPVAVIFPQLGLLINNGVIEPGHANNFIFGDFSELYFYLIAFVNGLLFCLPKPKTVRSKFALFTIRSITLSFSFYFFLVFLPFLPLSVVAVVVAGVGFLMLTPLVLFVWHIFDISTDFKELRPHYPIFLLRMVAFAGFWVLPFLLVTNYYYQKKQFQSILNYAFQNDSYQLPDRHDISIYTGKKVIGIVESHRNNNRDFSYSQTPFLTTLYNTIVLNNMTLSPQKLNKLKLIFEKEHRVYSNANTPTRLSNTENTFIDSVSVSTRFSDQKQMWQSDIRLFIQNNHTNLAEYATRFSLPDDAAIADYYLMNDDVKLPGILAEKKAATWIYNQIVNTNRDPGLLKYTETGELELRVFPFGANQMRETGFTVLHSQPLRFFIDSISIETADSLNKSPNTVQWFLNNQLAYVPPQAKQKLPVAQRKPYLHFIVDAHYAQTNLSQITDLMQKNAALFNITTHDAKISLTDAYVKTFDYQAGLEALKSANPQGGFFAERAVKQALIQQFRNMTSTFPVLVILSEKENMGALMTLNGFEKALPEFPYIVADNHLNESALIWSVQSNRLFSANQKDSLWNPKTYRFRFSEKTTKYLPYNNKPVVEISALFEHNQTKNVNNNKAEVFLLKALRDKALFLATNTQQEWLTQIQFAFTTGLLNTETAFLAVENEAQRQMLLKKQKQRLAGNQAADFDDQTIRMSEPSFIILVLFLSLMFFVERNREKKKCLNKKK